MDRVTKERLSKLKYYQKLKESRENTKTFWQRLLYVLWKGWRHPDFWSRITNPFAVGLLWLMTVSIGGAFSLYNVQILDFRFPFTAGASDEINWYTLGAFIGVVVVAFLFGIQNWVKQCRSEKIIDNLLTMPPANFWEYAENIFIDLDRLATDAEFLFEKAYEDDENRVTPPPLCVSNLESVIKDTERNIRVALDQIIRLARHWDVSNLHGDKVTYRANIMEVHHFFDKNGKPINTSSGEKADLVKLAEPFCVEPFDHKYTGVVALADNTFTTTTETTEPDVDDKRVAIAFPFTLDSDQRAGYLKRNNFLGAPTAVQTRKPSYIKCFSQVIENYAHGDYVVDGVLEALDEYYNKNGDAHSILAIPLVSHLSNRVEYVLNIYMDRRGLLHHGEKAPDFAKIIVPFCSAIGRTLSQLQIFRGDLEAAAAFHAIPLNEDGNA